MHKTGTRDRLIAELHTVVENAEALLKATSAEGGEKIEGLRTRVEQSVHQARERIAHAEAEALEQAHKAATTAESYVQEKPWQSVGIAAGVGFVLGLLINRR